MNAETGANNLAHSNGMLVIKAPREKLLVRGGPRRIHDRDTLIEGGLRGKADPALFISRVLNGHGRGVHEVEKPGSVRRGTGRQSKLKAGSGGKRRVGMGGREGGEVGDRWRERGNSDRRTRVRRDGRRDVNDIGAQGNRLGGTRDLFKETNGKCEALVIVRFV